MIQGDPLLSAYREAAWIYFHVSDMPPDVRTCFLEGACAGKDLVRSSVQALVDESGTAATSAIPPSAGAHGIAETLHRFMQAITSGAHSEVTPYVPSAAVPGRERILVELIKLDQKARWFGRQPKALESYLHEWPELRPSSTLIAELLRSECLARAVFAAPATEAELALRFPALAGSIGLEELGARAEVVARGLALGSVTPPVGLPGRFAMVRKIGQGGMGIVYEVTDRRRGTQVALKTLPRMDPRALLRFKREFRTLTGLTHRNLVSLYELVSDGTQWLFTMELINGADFKTHVRRHGHAMAETSIRDALIQLAEGVMALHGAGILHCDLKPPNVLVSDDGRVVILDFGVAKELSAIQEVPDVTTVGGRPRSTPTGSPTALTSTDEDYVLGSVAYMSPEQAMGERLTEASDWYSVGVMLYEGLTGRVPFAGHPDVLMAKQCDDPPRPSHINPRVSKDLDDLSMALLDRDPASRPTGLEILDRLTHGKPHERQRVTMSRSLPFVGRAAHLSTLAEAYRALEERRTVTVHIRGRSGAGKTALAQRFLSGLPADAIVLSGRCYEQESVPYKALDSVIDRLCRYLMRLSAQDVESMIPPDIPALARIFPVLERIDAVRAACENQPAIPDAREVRRRAFAALAETLRRIGAKAPLALFIDDLQWGDVDSAALLISLLDAPEPPSLLFLACYRSEYVDTNPCLVALNAARNRKTSFDVEVEPLTFDDSLELASLLLKETNRDPSAAAVRVARESGGNPYFVYELARQLDTAFPSSVADGPVVLNLDDVLWRRVQSLADPVRRLLEVVAIAGKPLPLWSAADASALGDGLPSAVAVLRAEHLVRTTGPGLDNEIETYHDRIRESVANHLPESRRADHHRRLALALEAAGHADIEEIASHFHRAGGPDSAARHYAMAADKAAAALAFDRSAELYGLALELGKPVGAYERTLRKKRADALANAGRGYEAGQEYQRAAIGAGLEEVVDLQRNAGYQYCVSGHIDQGRDAFASVLAHFGTRLPRTRRQALISLLWRRFRLGLRGMGFRERAEIEVPRHELDRVDIFWSVAAGMTIADPIRGADFQTLDLILALRAGEPYRIARALAWEAAHLSMIGVRLQPRAEAQLAAAEALAQRIDVPHATGMTLMSRGVAAYFHGDFAECQRRTEAAVRIFRERCTGVAWELETCNAFAFWPLYFKGQYGELTRRFGPLIAEARERGARLAEADLTTFGGPFVWLAADDPDGADRAVRGVMGEWSRQDFQVQHFTMLTAEAQISLYRGDGPAAWQRVVAQWSGLADAMLLYVEIVRIYMLHLRARCALAAAVSGGDRERLLGAAARDARRLERQRPRYAKALAKTIRSALMVQRGDAASAAALLGTAADELNALGWGCFGMAARRQYGHLLGGHMGNRIVREVDDYLAEQQVKRPDLLCAVQAPGFDRR